MIEGHGQHHGPVVLVVDDDMAMRLLMRESLEGVGLTVEEAENGVEALAAFERVRPDLVLMDVRMPKMDGITACAKLRQMPGGDDATVVMVTGLEDIESIRQSYEAGGTDFITKPVNWSILTQRVLYLLRAREAFRALRRSEARLAQAQRVARLGSWDWEIGTNDLCWSEEAYRIYGLERNCSRASHETLLGLVHPEDRDQLAGAIDEALNESQPYSIDYRIIRPDGKVRVVHDVAEVDLDETGEVRHFFGSVQDITERKMAEEQIRMLAYYDALTGLPNRRRFSEHAQFAMSAARRNGTKMALIYLDLDRFKRINDTMGHTAGDRLLKKVAENLTKSVRGTDIVATAETNRSVEASLARLGGDEFTILLTGLYSVNSAARVARRLQENLSEAVVIEDGEFVVTGSMGIAVYPDDGDDLDVLLKNADIAMYAAKDEGRNKFRFFSEEMNSRMQQKLALEVDLRKALERGELEVYYQPQVDTVTRKIVGVEALVRWHHPEKGLVLPLDFIPAAEETGLILPLGEWVLQTACAQAAAWRARGFGPLRVAVNISALQLEKGDLVGSVKHALDIAHLDAEYLSLELTESALMRDHDETVATLQELKEVGVSLSVDDFGTGYSSLNYLKKFPLDFVKIDRSFVRDLVSNPDDAAITKAVIALAKALDLTTIAEGVEEHEQLAFLTAKGCDEYQGFLISPPRPADEIERLLEVEGAEPEPS